MSSKKLLILAHAPSTNTQALVEAALKGARHPDLQQVTARWIAPLDAQTEDVLAADAILLGTTENLGTMSGALKDFFDRCYYPLLEQKQGLPCALFIRAGQDGTGTQRAVTSIVTGLRWKWVQEPLILRGPWQTEFLQQTEDLALTLAAGLDTGVF